MIVPLLFPEKLIKSGKSLLLYLKEHLSVCMKDPESSQRDASSYIPGALKSTNIYGI